MAVGTLTSEHQLRLRLIRSSIFIFNEAGNDPVQTVDMVDAMLLDLHDKGNLRPISEYVHVYSTRHDSWEQAEKITLKILELDPETLAGF